MKTLAPVLACVLVASALYLGFPELRADRPSPTACQLAQPQPDTEPQA